MHPEDSGTAGPFSNEGHEFRTFSPKQGQFWQQSTPISADSADYWPNSYKGNNWVSELACVGL
jgi:hypothetical protein